jgi:hypothetical protein
VRSVSAGGMRRRSPDCVAAKRFVSAAVVSTGTPGGGRLAVLRLLVGPAETSAGKLCTVSSGPLPWCLYIVTMDLPRLV